MRASTSCKVKFMRVLLVRQTFQRFVISRTTVTLANQTKRNVPCSSYLLFSYAISTGFNGHSSCYHCLHLFSCSNDSRTLSALRETFTNASQPTPNVLIRKNCDPQNSDSGKGRGSLGSEKNEGVRDPPLPFHDYLTRRLTARVQRTRRI